VGKDCVSAPCHCLPTLLAWFGPFGTYRSTSVLRFTTPTSHPLPYHSSQTLWFSTLPRQAATSPGRATATPTMGFMAHAFTPPTSIPLPPGTWDSHSATLGSDATPFGGRTFIRGVPTAQQFKPRVPILLSYRKGQAGWWKKRGLLRHTYTWRQAAATKEGKTLLASLRSRPTPATTDCGRLRKPLVRNTLLAAKVLGTHYLRASPSPAAYLLRRHPATAVLYYPRACLLRHQHLRDSYHLRAGLPLRAEPPYLPPGAIAG